MNLMLMAHSLTMLAGGSIDGNKKPLDVEEIVGVLVAGLGVVFAALILLVIIIFLFGKLFDAINAKQKNKETAKAAEKAPKAAPAKAAAPAPVPAAPVQAAAEDDDEVIAVISAVVAMMSEADGTVYKVKSVKPAASAGLGGRAAWAMDGRRQNVAPF